MKKTWNSPEVQELTIQATAFGYGRGYGDKHGYGGRGDGGRGDGGRGDGGRGDSDLCRCDGGTSPCNKHHGWDEDFES